MMEVMNLKIQGQQTGNPGANGAAEGGAGGGRESGSMCHDGEDRGCLQEGEFSKREEISKKITLLAACFLKDLLVWFMPLSSTCPNAG